MQEAQSLVIHPSPKNRYMEKVLFLQQLRFVYKTGVGNLHTFHLNQTAIPCTNLCKAERLEIGTLRASLKHPNYMYQTIPALISLSLIVNFL